MAIELKTDSRHRYVLYSRDDYMRRGFTSRDEKQQAVEAGKKFTLTAYPDVWAKDAGLVQRVRQFLGEYFHWHDRLAKSDADLEVVETLFEMVRGGSIVVIPEDPPRGGSVGGDTPRAAATTSLDFVGLAMDRMGLSREAALQYADDYNDLVDRYYATMDKIAAPLGDAQPFDYGEDAPSRATEELAASTNNPNYAAKMLGYDRNTFGKMLHKFKPNNGLGPADNVIWHDNGDVYFKGNFVANFHDWAN